MRCVKKEIRETEEIIKETEEIIKETEEIIKETEEIIREKKEKRTFTSTLIHRQMTRPRSAMRSFKKGRS
ncbi:hypothetical protein MSBR3_0993 [Methanosarcina barkeri 3]|uniref:Uncharacterized protein n=1 Tax=Methanosarcina barkeri 3 TaxID=1434107 RepID=A0A0E3SJ42_METBA|nr:hypothetical protein [Methanosarcina barkeri]AKB81571.1 hypothetical protein MSBR3_0993 [Methanosarcina barkeri 3]